MIRTLIYLLEALLVGWLVSLLQLPAGWLVGSLLFGVFYRLRNGDISMPSSLFPFALSIIGASIGLTMKISMFKEVASYFLPLVISLISILIGSWFLSRLLARYSHLDPKTALFCCVPGGASATLALSQEYGADQRIVAAFQMSRAIFIALSIPILAGLVAKFTVNGSVHSVDHTAKTVSHSATVLFPGFNILCTLAVVALSLWLAKVAKIPAAPLLYGMLLAFLLNQFVVHIGPLPTLVVGMGQALLGAIIGVGFDREAIKQLKKIGWLSLVILAMFLILTFIISLIFFGMTPLDFVTSMLAMAPGGAPQMSSTAAVLGLDASIVAAIQLIRLLIIYLLVPFITPYLIKKTDSQRTNT